MTARETGTSGEAPRYRALAADYDGTLAVEGVVAATTVAALEQVRASGRRLLLVTGRQVPDLRAACPRLDLFDRVVAENGAVLYDPATHALTLRARPPSAEFVAALRARGVATLAVGQVVIATVALYETAARTALRELGADMTVSLNKGSVMILPRGVDKGTGLRAALRGLKIPPGATVGVGDAENDVALLARCGFAVAVANALPALKRRADLVTQGANGAGVAELAELLVATDLRGVAPP